MEIRVLHIGLGPIGVGIARQVLTRRGLVVAGAVDLDPSRIGRDVGEAVGLRRRLGVKVSSDLAATIKASRPDIAIISTTSSLKEAWPTFESVLRQKVPIVSTTEELVYPMRTSATLAKRIDAMAKRSRVAVLGTGVNPGFVMDALPISMTGLCTSVQSVEVDRVQDARIRRVPFQQKIGAGLTAEQFSTGVKTGAVRHVGLSESISMIADALGWKLDRITDEVHPKISEHAVTGGAIPLDAGMIAGIVQDAVGYRKGKAMVTLHMEAYLGAPESYDEIRILGTPPLSMRIAGGVHGDIATAAIIVNSIPKVLEADPGLRTMRDMELPSFFDGQGR